MSDKTIDKLWGFSLVVEGVCAVIMAGLNMLGMDLPEALSPVLLVLLVVSVLVTSYTTAQKQKRAQKRAQEKEE